MMGLKWSPILWTSREANDWLEQLQLLVKPMESNNQQKVSGINRRDAVFHQANANLSWFCGDQVKKKIIIWLFTIL